MGFKIKNSLTGEFEKLPILTLKGEKGETGGVEEYNKVDYMGNKYETLKQANDANVEYAVKTAIGEFNYLDYDGQHITATDTIEGRSKSAILKGQTFVNVYDYTSSTFIGEATIENGVITLKANGGWVVINNKLPMLKPNTNYTIFVNILSNTLNYSSIELDYALRVEGDTGNSGFITGFDIPKGSVGIFKKLLTTKESLSTTNLSDVRVHASANGGEIKFTYMIIEGDHTQEDIPYFEGMQSVKMPVLTTTGKNLFKLKTPDNTAGWGGHDFSLLENGFSFQAKSGWNSVGFNIGHPNQQITVSATVLCSAISSNKSPKQNMGIGNVGYVVENRVKFVLGEEKRINLTFNLSDTGTVWFYGSSEEENPEFKNEVVEWVIKDIQVELGSQSTSYEPFKSNILHTPEEVVLRSVENAQDTINLNTGEYVQRIEEVILNGSEPWELLDNNTENTIGFSLHNFLPLRKTGDKYVKVNCDKLPSYKENLWKNDKIGCVAENNINQDLNNTQFQVRVLKSTLSTQDTNGFKSWLQTNPLTIQYILETPVIKTVDLSDSHVYSYDNITHYDCSSAEGSLVPTLSVKVPTDVQATIAQQRETIQTLNSENERLNQIQEALKASMLDSQVQLMNLSWDTDFEVFTLRESIAPKDFLLDSRTGSNIDKFSQAKFIIENDCPDLEKLNSQIEYYFSKDVFSQEQFEELTDLISIVKGGNGCEY